MAISITFAPCSSTMSWYVASKTGRLNIFGTKDIKPWIVSSSDDQTIRIWSKTGQAVHGSKKEDLLMLKNRLAKSQLDLYDDGP